MAMIKLLEACDPITKLLWVLNVSVVGGIMVEPIQLLALLLWLIFCLVFLSAASLLGLLRYWKILLFVPSLLFIFHVLLQPGHVIYEVEFVKVTREGLIVATNYSLKLFCSILALVTYILTTNMRDLIISLIRLRMPNSFAYSVYLMLRFIPIITVEAEAILMALRTRAPHRRSISLRLLLWQRYLFALVMLGVRRAKQTALAMDSRGFSLTGGRTFMDERRWGCTGIIFLILNMVLSWSVTLRLMFV